MNANALLLVSKPALLHRRLGGLSVLERQLFTARRAGIERLWVAAPKPGAGTPPLRIPAGLQVSWLDHQADASHVPTPYLAISGEHFVRVETLAHVVKSRYGGPAALEDASGAAVIQVVPFRADAPAPAQRQALPAGASVLLEEPLGGGPALNWLLSTGTKSADGFMARHFDRHISLAVSRLLLDTPVTPNMMTLASSAIGLYGTTFFLQPGHATRLAGAALVWLHSVLDGCDGELARMRFQESPVGAAMDFWGDNLVHLSLFWCLAWGFFKADQSVLPLLCGLAAAVGTLGSAALVYAQKRRPAPAQPRDNSFLQRLEDMLAARDFIYLLLILAYIDRTYEFLWAAGVGSLLFLIMTLYLGGRHEQARQPYPGAEGQVGNPASGHGGGL